MRCRGANELAIRQIGATALRIRAGNSPCFCEPLIVRRDLTPRNNSVRITSSPCETRNSRGWCLWQPSRAAAGPDRRGGARHAVGRRVEAGHHRSRNRAHAGCDDAGRDVSGVQTMPCRIRCDRPGDCPTDRGDRRDDHRLADAAVGPSRFTSDGRIDRFEGNAALGKLLTGVIAPYCGVPKRSSWNQIAGFLESMRALRDSSGFTVCQALPTAPTARILGLSLSQR
jgi:hypothetical protein